jgi:hypothetical protein
MSTRFTPGVRSLCVIPLVLMAALLAACGSSSPTSTAQSAATRFRAHLTKQAHPDPVTNGVVVHRPQHGTGGAEINDDNPGHADVGDQPAAGREPCKLVSQAQAQAIVGRPVGTPVEAPLGPTCIYRPVGSKSFITLAVEPNDLAKVRRQIRDRTRLDVRGRKAYCGTYGQPTVFVPLANGHVLAITAPCAIGAKFAATALPRLGA